MFTFSNSASSKRYCRFGAGEEQTPNTCDTPGFRLCDKDAIEEDRWRHIKFLRLRRNDKRMKETSNCMLQSWRANCDVSILIYDQDPMKLNFRDIAQVTSYIVAYCSKGNASFRHEREVLSDMCKSCDTVSGLGSVDTTNLIKKMLNRISNSRIISKAEASCLVLGLPLYKCTESFKHVSISPFVKVVEQNKCQNRSRRSILDIYMNRPKLDAQISLYDFVRQMEENTRLKALSMFRTKQIHLSNLMLPYQLKKRVIHCTGMNGYPVYPVRASPPV